MAASKPVALCTLVMPSGNRCRAIALRNQRFCRAHSQTRRVYERERTVVQMLDRLKLKVDALDTPDLLYLLHQRLGRLQKTLRRFPDAGYILTAALDRIDEIKQLESQAKQQMQQNHLLLAEIRKYQMKSGAYAQVISNQSVNGR